MPYNATVYKIMIASPGDVEKEKQIIRDVINEWNVIHSFDRQIVLLPVAWDTHSTPTMGDRPQAIINKKVLADADLLIAVFWTRIGTPTGKAQSGTVEEINEHVGAKKPAMIYFSNSPIPQDSYYEEQINAVREFKKQCINDGLIQTYDSTDDFEKKLQRQLASKVIEKFVFNESIPDNKNSIINKQVMTYDSLSEDAKTLLIATTEDPYGVIMKTLSKDGLSIQTNGENMITENNAREESRWEDAFEQLVSNKLIRDRGFKGEVFVVTHQGYETADLLKNDE